MLDFLQVGVVGGPGFAYSALLVVSLITINGDFLHVFVADRARAFEDGLIIEFQHFVHVVAPEIERQLLLLFDPQFSLFKKNDYKAVEGVDLVGVQVVLGDNDILLAHPRPATRSSWLAPYWAG